LSIGKYITGKQTECKNHLKLLSKKNYSSVFHNELEMSWLLFADSFIAISKFDNAEELLKKCLKYNRCCAKAEEFMGLIKEKESMYIDAASHYEKAFSISNSKNTSIGYRLAFNYFKAKRYIECLDICNKVLTI
jgi:tetratricopeptide repeat protein 21B